MQVWNQTQAELLSRFSLSIRLSLHNSFSLSPSLSSNCIPSQSTWLRRRTYSWQFHFFMKNLSLFFYFCPSLSEPLSLSLLLPRFSIAFFFFFSPSLPLSLLYFCHLFFTQVTTWHRRAISQLPPPTSWLFIGHFFNYLSFTFFYLVNRLMQSFALIYLWSPAHGKNK